VSDCQASEMLADVAVEVCYMEDISHCSNLKSNSTASEELAACRMAGCSGRLVSRR
jgi:hypothetical protein